MVQAADREEGRIVRLKWFEEECCSHIRMCLESEVDGVPGVCYDDVVEWRMALAEACKSDLQYHDDLRNGSIC